METGDSTQRWHVDVVTSATCSEYPLDAVEADLLDVDEEAYGGWRRTDGKHRRCMAEIGGVVLARTEPAGRIVGYVAWEDRVPSGTLQGDAETSTGSRGTPVVYGQSVAGCETGVSAPRGRQVSHPAVRRNGGRGEGGRYARQVEQSFGAARLYASYGARIVGTVPDCYGPGVHAFVMLGLARGDDDNDDDGGETRVDEMAFGERVGQGRALD